MARDLSVGWLLVGDERVASARIHGWNMHHELLRRGLRSEVINDPGAFDTRLRWKAPRRWWEAIGRRRNVLIFQKVESSRAVRLARLARRLGTRVVFLQADTLHSPLYQVADAVVVPSRELARLLGTICPAPITTIEDALELPREVVVVPSERDKGLRLLWVGNRENMGGLDLLRPILDRPEFQDLRLVTVSNHPEATYPWSQETVIRELYKADAGILPCEDTPAARAKSNNRLTLFMGVGLPVAASPLPAYREVVEHGQNGLLVQAAGDWVEALRTLRDPACRRRLGETGRHIVWERFSPRVMGDRWERLLRELTGRSRPD